MSEHDEDFKQPVVTDSPEFIWLQYGDIERDCTHHECIREGDVTWCEDSQFDSDVKYVRADLHETLRAELAAKEKALSSAKIALDAKDRSYSVIEQRFSAMAAKAATTDSERECNERLTAEIDALTAELAEARRQLAAQPAVPEAVAKDALALAYGYLWHVNNMRPGYDAPSGYSRPQLTPEKAAYKARGILRGLLTNEQRGEGINRADAAILSATDSEGRSNG